MPMPPFSRRRFFALGAGAAAAALVACTEADRGQSTFTPAASSPTSEITPAAAPSATPAATPTPATSIETKIGQMLMVGFRGLTIDSSTPFGAAIAAGRVGHVVLFDADGLLGSDVRNIQDPAQLTALTAQLQTLGPSLMLIAVDEEGGLVARLDQRHGFPATVSEQYLGQQDDVDLTARYAGSMAMALATSGVNLNLAPVVDLNVNPDNPVIGSLGRSFSADPDVVTRQATAFIDAFHLEHVLCTLKHFPGHGSSTADSHIGFVDVTNTWSRTELEPFRRIIAAGKADVVMTAHIFNATLDPDYPATLSKKTIDGILRGELGYDGVVVTDDMQMGAIRQQYGFEQAVELAVNAGADIVSIANTTVYEADVHERAFNVIAQAVQAGRINPARIDEAYGRITSLKRRLVDA
jgi:beta-N-acetylhexosaminidase